MHYNVLFRIEKLELVPKLKTKLKNLKKYMDDMGNTMDIEIVFSGNVVNYFNGNYEDFVDASLDIALCNNALVQEGMLPINDRNVRTVKAGIGEIIEKKSQGWIEFTIE